MRLCVSLMSSPYGGDVCLRVLSRFAFRKTLFCIALFSLCSLIVAWKSLDLLLYPLQHINHPAEASRDSRSSNGYPMAGWPPQLLLLTRGLSQHFKHHVRPWLGSASRSSTRSNRSGIGIAGCKPSWTPLPPDQCSKGQAGVHVYGSAYGGDRTHCTAACKR